MEYFLISCELWAQNEMGSDRPRHCHVLNCYFDRKCSFGRFYTCSNVSILNVHNVKANSVDPDQTAH